MSGVSDGLERLIGAEEGANDAPIPGENESTSSSPSAPPVDFRLFSEALLSGAAEQSSVTSRSRALCVAGYLRRALGDHATAEELFANAAELSPRLSLPSLLLRKTAAVDSEVVRHTTQAAMLQSSDASARRHNTSALLALLRNSGDAKTYGELLDHAARQRPSDRALVLERLSHRIAQEQSLAGVEIEPPLKDAVLFAQELLSPPEKQNPAFVPRKDFEQRTALHLLRAARYLKENDRLNCLQELESAGLEKATLLELRASSLAADGRQSESIAALSELVQLCPERRLLRTLAARALQARDLETLRWVLDKADPAAGTFELDERVLLQAACGDQVSLGSDELREVFQDNPELALALGPAEEPALVPKEASEDALLAQLGANLGELASANEEQLARVISAATELEARGSERELTVAVQVARALISELGPPTVEALRALSEVFSQPAGKFVTALLAEKLFGPKDSLQAYEQAAQENPVFDETVLRVRGLLSPEGFREHLACIANSTRSPWLRFCRRLETLLRTASSQVPAHEGVDLSELGEICRELSDSISAAGDTPPENLRSQISAVLFGAATVAETRGDADTEARLLEMVAETPSPYQDFILFRSTWLSQSTPEHASSGSPAATEDRLQHWRGSTDITQRVLATRLLGMDEQEPVRPTTPLELLAYIQRELLNFQLDTSSQASTRARGAYPLLGEIIDDYDELQGNVDTLSARWLPLVRQDEDPMLRQFALDKLRDLDERKKDKSSAAMWQRAALEAFPKHLPAIFRVQELDCAGRTGKNEKNLRQRVAEQLPPDDRKSYALLSGAEALSRSDLREAGRALLPLLDDKEPSTFVLRAILLIAHEKRDDALAERVDELLFERAGTDLDRASAALRVAYCRSRLGKPQQALSWALRALECKPGYFSAAQLQYLLDENDDAVQRAERLEAFAESSQAAPHRATLFLECGRAWQAVQDPERAASCFEATLSSAPNQREPFEQLLLIRHGAEDFEAQRQLIEQRLTLIPESSQEALALTLRLADLLIENDLPEPAKKHLERALTSHPGNVQALRAHAETAAKLGAHQSAERSLVALRDRLEPGPDRAAVLQSLAKLYSEHLHQWERAMDAYQAVLELDPQNRTAREALVDVYGRLGLGERATSLQTQLIVDAKGVDEKRRGALKLAHLYEAVSQDLKRAAATLERARKAWPLDADVLEATIHFMDRHGGGSRGFTLDRVASDARRKLETERLSGGLLDTLARVALLSGAVGQYEACAAARAAYLGEDHEPLSAGGLAALSEKVEDHLAPHGLARPLRQLLRKTGVAMDAAFSVDLSTFHPRPLADGEAERELAERAQKVSAALGRGEVEVLVSEGLGARCLPVTSEPARLLVGRDLAHLPGRQRDYLLLRAFKIQEMGVGALSRSRQEDRFPMIVALLHLFAPGWRPPPVDLKKASQARVLIEQGLAQIGYDEDVPMLALETIGALGGQSEGLGEASKRLASRAAMVGVGDIAQVLEAIAAGDAKALPPSGPSRFRWMEAHSEARELLLFATTRNFTKVRAELGLVPEPVSSPFSSTPENSLPPPSGPGARRPPAPPPPRRGMTPPLPPRRPKPKD